MPGSKFSSIYILIQKVIFILINLTALSVYAQTIESGHIDFSKPFFRCKLSIEKNERFLFASDNELLVTSNGSDIISYDIDKQTKNWKTELNGKINPKIYSDSKSLFIIINSNPSKQTSSYVTSVSLITGITEWQKALSESEEIQFVFENSIILKGKDNSITSLQKDSGNLIWSKGNGSVIDNINIISSEEIRVISQSEIKDFRINSGEISRQIELPANSVKSMISAKNYIIYGNTKGDVVKVLLTNQFSKILWRIKTGGSISSVDEINDGILVASFDNFIYLFNKSNGKIIWKKRLGGRILYRPSILAKSIIVVDSGDNTAFILEANTGKVTNQIEIDQDDFFTSMPYIIAGKILFSANSRVYLFSDSPC